LKDRKKLVIIIKILQNIYITVFYRRAQMSLELKEKIKELFTKLEQLKDYL